VHEKDSQKFKLQYTANVDPKEKENAQEFQDDDDDDDSKGQDQT